MNGWAELAVGAYLTGVGAGLLDLAWHAWKTRGVLVPGGGQAAYWWQYVAVVAAWPVFVWLMAAALLAERRARRGRSLWRLARDAGESRGEALVTVLVAAGTGTGEEAREAYRLEELTPDEGEEGNET